MADNEFALRKAMERATQAQTALENPAIIAAFKSIEENCIDGWRNSQPRDSEGRELLYQRMQALEGVRQQLETAVANGQLSALQIERDFQEPKRFGIV